MAELQLHITAGGRTDCCQQFATTLSAQEALLESHHDASVSEHKVLRLQPRDRQVETFV